jgi:biotin-dependent carboxylase-like uncharacterized protein
MIEVVLPGIQSSMQEVRPRRGMRWGIARGGAADRKAAMLANLVLGQEVEAPVLEVVSGFVNLAIRRRTRVALTGGGMIWHLEARTPAGAHVEESSGRVLSFGRPIELDAGDTLIGRPARPGFRSYLAVEGGLVGEEVAGSTATDLRLGLGGLQRRVRKGDLLRPRALPEPRLEPRPLTRHLGPEVTAYVQEEVVRLYPAPETAWFTREDAESLAATDWTLSPESNRMGLRLECSTGRSVRMPARQLLSTVVLPGTVQMTASGPIILFVDAQTTGGYPRIGQVCEADLPVLAQKAPGSTIRFAWITLDEALDLQRQQAQELRRLAAALSLP